MSGGAAPPAGYDEGTAAVFDEGAPAVPDEGATAVPEDGAAGSPWLWWLRGLVVLVALAAAAGGAVGGVYYVASGDDGWRDLGAMVVGMIVAAAVLAPGWLICVVLLARRFAPAGRRVTGVAVCVGTLAVAAVGLAALSSGDRLPSGVAAVVVGLVAVGAPPLVVPSRRLARPARGSSSAGR